MENSEEQINIEFEMEYMCKKIVIVFIMTIVLLSLWGQSLSV